MDIAQWEGFENARPVAVIHGDEFDLGRHLRTVFDNVPAADDSRQALILRLKTGEVVALVGLSKPHHPRVELLQRDDADPATTIRHFTELTGIDPAKVVPIDGAAASRQG